MAKNETDSRNLPIVSDKFGAAKNSGITRWAPLVVVLGVVGGFMTLSWYAYHAGMQSVKEEDLVVVEADKTPIKEKPADPGGMQFPNQDKTVFETFSAKTQQPPKVERVLPEPEEPLPKEADASDTTTTTWVNKDLPKKNVAEMVIGSSPKKNDELPHVTSPINAADEKNTYTKGEKTVQAGDHQIISAQSASEDDQSVTYIAPKAHLTRVSTEPSAQSQDNSAPQAFEPEKAASNPKYPDATVPAMASKKEVKEDQYAKQSPASEASPVRPVKERTVQLAENTTDEDALAKGDKHKKDARPAHTEASGGNGVVQLGAYRSQEEADAAWDKMHIKQKPLSDKKPVVLRVDLGSKGIYYRLRVEGLASATEAKSLCHELTAKGQPCIIPTGK